MRVVFLGTPEFAVPSLELLIGSRHELIGVITAPDKPAGRALKMTEPPVKRLTKKYNLPILQPDNLRDDEFLRRFRAWRPDIGIVVAFRLLPEECFSIPEHGCVNLHAALLPELRGAAPVNWALINGYNRTGVTTFSIDRGMDTGLIWLQKAMDIEPDENATRLTARLAVLGARLILDTLDGLESGELKPATQSGTPSRAPKIDRQDCQLDWSKSACRIHNLIRGLSYEPGAFTYLGQKVFKILRSNITDPVSSFNSPGMVVKSDQDGLYIAAGEGILAVEEVQLEGRQRMTSAEFLRGKVVKVGTILG